ncbi:MAG: thioredoxin family protein [Erysipelotrichaceae bacterium]|nr:thioredoxin family protein [Erysipelotrichaceae bacterium]
MIEQINESQLMGRINTDGVVLLEFYKQRSPLCEKMHQVLEQLQNTCTIYQIDIEQTMVAIQEYQIKTVPTVILLSNGIEQQRFEGTFTVEMILMAMELFRK